MAFENNFIKNVLLHHTARGGGIFYFSTHPTIVDFFALEGD